MNKIDLDTKVEIPAPEVVCFKSKGGLGLAAGQPIFFLRTPRGITVLESPTAYLHDRYVRNLKRTPSPHTWAASAQAIKVWFEFLYSLPKFKTMRDDPDIWKFAMRADRIFYRDCYVNYTNQAGDEFSKNTIASRMTVIMGLYIWAFKRGEYTGDMLTAISEKINAPLPIDDDALAHTRRDVILKTMDDEDLPKTSFQSPGKVNPLEPPAVAALLMTLGPSPDQSTEDHRPYRNRVITDLILDTGIRIQECMDLTIHQFLQIVTDPDLPFATYPLSIRGKGNKQRIVNVHGWIVDDVQRYINEERTKSLFASTSKVSNKAAVRNLWLNHATHRLAGKPLTKGALQKVFAEACKRAGLVIRKVIEDESTGEHITLEHPAHSIHDLRHTFAVRYCEAHWQMGNTEPWLALSRLLGHSNPTTTKLHYLRFVDLIRQKHIGFISKQQREVGK